MKNPDDVFTIGTDILATELLPSGVISVQHGDVIGAQVIAGPQHELWGPVGYYARPSKPDVGKQACQGIAINGGDRDIIIATRDLRQTPNYGNLADGEICLAAGGSDAKAMARVLLKADGSIVRSTTHNNTHDGIAIYDKIGPKGFEVQSPYGSIKLDSTGFHVVLPCGASMHLGPTSNPATPNYFKVSATQVYLDTPRCVVMPSVPMGGKGVALPVVVAPVGSPQTGVPVPIGAGLGVILGETGCTLFVGI
jgi:hypothetical protein